MSKTYTEDQYIRAKEQANIDGYQYGLMNGSQNEAALKAEIEALKSELYKLRLKGHGGAAGVDAIVEKADEMRQRYEAQSAELDYYRARTQELGQAIDTLWDQSVDRWQTWKDTARLTIDHINEASQRMRRPYLVEVLLRSHDLLMGVSESLMSETLSLVKGDLSPEQKVSLARQLISIVQCSRLACTFAQQAFFLLDHPQAICDEVYRQLNSPSGEVKDFWIEKLHNWIQSTDHPDKPAKPGTLKEWLERVNEQRKMGLKQQVYAELRGYERKTLERANRIYELVETVARTTPETLQKLREFIREQQSM